MGRINNDETGTKRLTAKFMRKHLARRKPAKELIEWIILLGARKCRKRNMLPANLLCSADIDNRRSFLLDQSREIRERNTPEAAPTAPLVVTGGGAYCCFFPQLSNANKIINRTTVNTGFLIVRIIFTR